MHANQDMGRFWDARAREDALFFVDDRLRYAEGDLDGFFAGGEEVLRAFERLLGVAFADGDRVVEIGCGAGRITRAIAARAQAVVAVDVSAEMLARARELNPDIANVEWLLGDGTSLRGVEGGSADVVFSHVVFQHLPDPALTLGYVREMGRVLRQGGWAAFQVSNDPAVHRRAGLRHRVRALVGRAPRGQAHPAWVGSAVDFDVLRKTAAEAGLDVERVTGKGTQFCLLSLRRR
ncbi:MAG: class I SAM-dependent methyltransferase [Solirubrobacteraceae bacterium]